MAKANTVIGVFQTRAAAEEAILELQRAGFADNRIGMVARNDKGELVTEKAGETMAEEGLAAGAVVGAGAGALVGLGVLAGTIPVIGPVMAVGTLGTILLNAAAGAAVVGPGRCARRPRHSGRGCEVLRERGARRPVPRERGRRQSRI